MASVVRAAAKDVAHESPAGADSFHHHGWERRGEPVPAAPAPCASWTNAPRAANSGRLLNPTGISSATWMPGEMNVTCRCGGSSGTTTAPGFSRSTRVSRALVMRQIGPRRGHLLLQVEQGRPGTIHFDARHQPAGEPGHLLDQHFRPGHGVQRAGQTAAGLLHVEIGRGHFPQGIVPHRLQVGLAGRQFLAGGQRTEDGVGDGKIEGRSAAPRRVVLVILDDSAIGRLVQSVMTVIIGPHVQVRQPEDSGVLQQRGRLFHACLGKGNDQRPGVRQAEGRGQIDRQNLVRRPSAVPARSAGAGCVR